MIQFRLKPVASLINYTLLSDLNFYIENDSDSCHSHAIRSHL
jgi:hypothetical protein